MAAELEILTDRGVLELEQGAYKEFYITRQIHDLHNFETRNADFSREMQIPPSPQNLFVLNLQQDTVKEQGVPCSITMGGVTVAPKAILYYLGTEVVNKVSLLRIQILFGNFNFINDIKTTTIDKLNWADLALSWITANCLTISQNTTNLCYALCDWSDYGVVTVDGRNHDINLEGFFTYTHTIIERIIFEAGWTTVYEANLPSDFFIIALACPITKFLEPVDVGNLVLVEEVTKTVAQVVNNTVARVIFETAAPNWSNGNNQFTIPATDNYIIQLQAQIEHVENGNRPASTIRIYQNASILAEFSTEIDLPPGTQIYLSADFAATAGDLIYCEMESNHTQTTLIIEATGGVLKLSTPGSEVTRDVQPSEWIPQMEAKNFMTSILNIFNLVITSNDITREVTIRNFNDVFTSNEQNLSNKLDVNSDIEITPGLSSIGQNSNFTWINDRVNRRDFDLTLKFNENILLQETDVIALPFSACDDSINYFIASFDTEPKVKLPAYTNTWQFFVAPNEPIITILDAALGTFALDREENFEVGSWFGYEPAIWHRVIAKTSNTTGILEFPIVATPATQLNMIINFAPVALQPRLAMMHIDGGGDQATITNGNTSVITIMSLNSHIGLWADRLPWGTLVNNYYDRLMSALQTPLVIKAKMNISILDFAALDHLRPIYVDQYAAFFYLNKLEQFKLNSQTQVELIRISAIEDL